MGRECRGAITKVDNLTGSGLTLHFDDGTTMDLSSNPDGRIRLHFSGITDGLTIDELQGPVTRTDCVRLANYVTIIREPEKEGGAARAVAKIDGDRREGLNEAPKMRMPGITHLQFLVLGIVGSEKSGREVRGVLGTYGERKSAPAFYQLMARLEDAKLVEGWYVQKNVDGKSVRERWYRVTNAGKMAVDDVVRFYLEMATF